MDANLRVFLFLFFRRSPRRLVTSLFFVCLVFLLLTGKPHQGKLQEVHHHVAVLFADAAHDDEDHQLADLPPPPSSLSSKWVVIISSSVEWKNYRHTANALAFHAMARSLGVDPSRIILLLSHPSLACEPDNVFPGHIRQVGAKGGRTTRDVYPVPYYATADDFVYRNPSGSGGLPEWSGRSSEPGRRRSTGREELWTSPVMRSLDYCGGSVNVETVLALLEGREPGEGSSSSGDDALDPHTISANSHLPRRKTLDSDAYADIVLYVVGHGYTSYFNFNAFEFISAQQLGRAIDRMYQKGRYGRLLLLLDTCQAITMCEAVQSPNVVCLAASNTTAFSYSSHVDSEVGLTTGSDWMERLLASVAGDSCFPSPTTKAPRLGSALHAPLGALSRHLLPDDDAMRSFGVEDGLQRWSLADFLCPTYPETVVVETLVTYDLDDFLLPT